MKVSFTELKQELLRVLLKLNFSPAKAELCADIFASNSRDGVYSHGLTRFPVFVEYVNDGTIKIDAEPEVLNRGKVIEEWTGNYAPGMYVADLAMKRAIELAKNNGMGCVSVKETNHWMRGGTYGWQAAEAGCIGICFTNTIANMPPWGGKEARLGNNPLVIAVPRPGGHVVLDMAMSQFSYGKLQETTLKGKKLPVPGGYNNAGELTVDPNEITESYRALPIGFWKGSGLSFILDVLLTALSGGRSVAEISSAKKEAGVSQLFLCIHKPDYHAELIEKMIDYTKSSALASEGDKISYPGENTLATRLKNMKEGIEVNDEIWQTVRSM